MKSLQIISLLISLQGACQLNDSLKTPLTFSTKPVEILNFWNGPNINLGIEFRIKGRSINYFDVGYYFEGLKFTGNNNWNELNGGYVLDEFRQYFKTHSSNSATSNIYWGIEIIYGWQSYYRSDTISLTTGNELVKYQNKRQFIGLCGNYGYNYTFHSGIMIGLRLGLGIRYNQIKNELTKEQASSRNLGDWNNPTGWIQQKGTHFIPKINFVGLTFGYTL